MSIFHELATQSAVDFVNNNSSTLNLVRELSHKFKLKVMAETDQLVLMCYPNGVPAGYAFTELAYNRAQEKVTEYCFASPYVIKNRSVGGDRRTRRSTSMSQLLKKLATEIKDDWRGMLDNYQRLSYIVERMISSEDRNSGSRHGLLSGALEFALLKAVLDDEPLAMNHMSSIREAYETHLKRAEAQTARSERFRNFNKDLYVVYAFKHQPVLIGTAKFDPTSPLLEPKYTVQDDLKAYSSFDDLPPQFNQLVLTHKMWHVNTETKHHRSFEDVRDYACEAARSIPRTDSYSEDFDVCTYSSTCYQIQPFGTCNIFLTPIVETLNAD
jgi:hypothetical protein